MSIPHAKPGEMVDVRPLGPALASDQTRTLVKASQVKVIRLIVKGERGRVSAPSASLRALTRPRSPLG